MPFAACCFRLCQIAAITRAWAAGIDRGQMLAATMDVSKSVNRWFRRSSSVSDSGIWIVILLAILGLWLGLYLWDRSRQSGKQARNDRKGLFDQLCDLHNLSRTDRLLLKKAAKTQNLEQPALAFVDPQILLDYAEASPTALIEARGLVDRLFGDALAEEIVRGSQTPEPSAI